MKHTYSTRGVCSSQIDFEIEGDKVKNVKFTNGCNGNARGIAALVEGMNVDDVIRGVRGRGC